MKMKAPVMLSLLTVLVFASPPKANQEVQGNVKPNAVTDNYSKVIEIIVVGGLTSSFLKQIFDK